MIKITKNLLKNLFAGYVTEAGMIGLPADTFIEKLLEAKKVDYANWLVCHCLSTTGQRKHAVYSAELVFHLWAKDFPKEAAGWRAWVDAGCPDGELREAECSADAACSVADAAKYAAWYAADADAARSAADAAWCADYAAWCAAARSAADAAWCADYAAWDAMLEKIVRHGLELLREEQKH